MSDIYSLTFFPVACSSLGSFFKFVVLVFVLCPLFFVMLLHNHFDKGFLFLLPWLSFHHFSLFFSFLSRGSKSLKCCFMNCYCNIEKLFLKVIVKTYLRNTEKRCGGEVFISIFPLSLLFTLFFREGEREILKNYF